MKQKQITTIVLSMCVFLGIASGALFYGSGANVTRMIDKASVVTSTETFSTYPLSFTTSLSDDDNPIVSGSVVLQFGSFDQKNVAEQSAFVVQGTLTEHLSSYTKEEVLAPSFEEGIHEELVQSLSESFGFEVKKIAFVELKIEKEHPKVQLDEIDLPSLELDKK